MDKLMMMKDKLIGIVECQMERPECVNTKELGEVIDMIKDISEACYYYTIVEAMEKGGSMETTTRVIQK